MSKWSIIVSSLDVSIPEVMKSISIVFYSIDIRDLLTVWVAIVSVQSVKRLYLCGSW